MTNYVQYSRSGRLESYSDTSEYAANWDDLRFPVTAINPPGSASDPDVDLTNGTLLFAANSTETVFVVAQLPHAYQHGGTLYPHLHWAKTTSASGNVYWELKYRWSRIGEVMDAAESTLSSSETATDDDDTAEQHIITALGPIDGTGAELSDMLLMQLSRVGGNAADTYGADCRLLEFDIHYPIDSMGSEEQFVK